jgi:hypothetical protein
MVRRVGVEPTLDSARCHLQGAPPGGHLDCFEIQTVDSGPAYERRDLGDDFGVEGFFEPLFFAVSSETAPAEVNRISHIRSLSSTRSRTNARNRLCSAICCCVCSTAAGGMILVRVFPPNTRVSDQEGP